MPAVIHNNWIKGTTPKLDRLHNWNLHSADEEKEICLDIPQLSPPTLSAPTARPRLSIRVLSGQSPTRLQALLASLSQTDYEGDGVGLVVSLDAGRGGDVAELKKMVEGVGWTHGEVKVEDKDEEGVAGGGRQRQWTGWKGPDDEEVVLVVEEDAQLSPSWYRTTRLLLSRYYTGAHYDPRVYGISLTRPHVIIGETHDQRWGSVLPSDLLRPFASSPLYKYQLLSQSAVVLFPHHWRMFLDWLQAKEKAYVPCTPTLITNAWLSEDRDQHWAAYFHRFIFEQGWYALYLNAADSQALAIAAAEYGHEHFTAKHRASVSVLMPANVSLVLGAAEGGGVGVGVGVEGAGWPADDAIPVFDLHMKLVNVIDTLSWRQHLTPPQFFSDQCWVLERLETKLREDAEKVEKERVDKLKAHVAKQKQDEADKKKKKEDDERKKKEAGKPGKAAPGAAGNGTKAATNSSSAIKPQAKAAKAVNATKAAGKKEDKKGKEAKAKAKASTEAADQSVPVPSPPAAAAPPAVAAEAPAPPHAAPPAATEAPAAAPPAAAAAPAAAPPAPPAEPAAAPPSPAMPPSPAAPAAPAADEAPAAAPAAPPADAKPAS